MKPFKIVQLIGTVIISIIVILTVISLMIAFERYYKKVEPEEPVVSSFEPTIIEPVQPFFTIDTSYRDSIKIKSLPTQKKSTKKPMKPKKPAPEQDLPKPQVKKNDTQVFRPKTLIIDTTS